MTIKQTSQYLGLNEFTTYRLVKNGTIPAVKKETGKWLISKDDIDNFFELAIKSNKNNY